MKIVILERKSVGMDVDVSQFGNFGELVIYNTTEKDQVAERVKDADIIIANKAPINEEIHASCLKCLYRIAVICCGHYHLGLYRYLPEYLETFSVGELDVHEYDVRMVFRIHEPCDRTCHRCRRTDNREVGEVLVKCPDEALLSHHLIFNYKYFHCHIVYNKGNVTQ